MFEVNNPPGRGWVNRGYTVCCIEIFSSGQQCYFLPRFKVRLRWIPPLGAEGEKINPIAPDES